MTGGRSGAPAQQHEERRAIAQQHSSGHPVADQPAPAGAAAGGADAGAGGEAPHRTEPGPEALRSLIEAGLEDDKAQAVTVIDLADKTTIADYMVIASGTSRRQVSAMAERLLERLKAAGVKRTVADGRDQGDWVLIDAGEVVVHLFRPEVRAFYNLEKMWGADLPEPEGDAAGAETVLQA